MTDYKDLIVWQKSMELARIIYRLTSRFPRDEVFGLTNQIRRAVVSIPSNIAEGFGRGSDREFIHFLRIAKGSAAEVETQILISEDLHYVSPDTAQTALSLFDEYCTWLFDILFELEKRTDMTGYDTYESWLFGFMSERLFNVWLERQNLKKCEVPVVFLENIDWPKKIAEFLKRKVTGKR